MALGECRVRVDQGHDGTLGAQIAGGVLRLT
jgi:hypothetical protein